MVHLNKIPAPSSSAATDKTRRQSQTHLMSINVRWVTSGFPRRKIRWFVAVEFYGRYNCWPPFSHSVSLLYPHSHVFTCSQHHFPNSHDVKINWMESSFQLALFKKMPTYRLLAVEREHWPTFDILLSSHRWLICCKTVAG